MRVFRCAAVCIAFAACGTTGQPAPDGGAPADASTDTGDAGIDAGATDAGPCLSVGRCGCADNREPRFTDLASFRAMRQARWATAFEGALWDAVYDGTDSAADGVPDPFRWDVPLLDDWNYQWDLGAPLFRKSMIPNYNGCGFLFVDSVDNAIDDHETAYVGTHDPLLASVDVDGLTVEMRLRLYPQSAPDGLIVLFFNDHASVQTQVAFTPTTSMGLGRVRVGEGDPQDNAFPVDIPSDGYHVFRVIESPLSSTQTVALHVFLDGAEVGYGEVHRLPPLGEPSATMYTYPLLIIGDASGTPGLNAAFDLDYVKYRRGEIAPTQGLTPLPPRTPPPLPGPAASPETFFGTLATPADFMAVHLGGGDISVGSDGNALWNVTENAMVCDPAGTTGTSGTTIELKVKVLPGSEPSGWGLEYMDQLGAMTVSLSPGGVTMSSGSVGVGLATAPVDLTDGYHVIRLVRPALSLYAYVYLDGDPIPVISDYHVGGDVTPYTCSHDGSTLLTRLYFGQLPFPRPGAKPNVEVAYLRWNGAPAAPGP